MTNLLNKANGYISQPFGWILQYYKITRYRSYTKNIAHLIP